MIWRGLNLIVLQPRTSRRRSGSLVLLPASVLLPLRIGLDGLLLCRIATRKAMTRLRYSGSRRHHIQIRRPFRTMANTAVRQAGRTLTRVRVPPLPNSHRD